VSADSPAAAPRLPGVPRALDDLAVRERAGGSPLVVLLDVDGTLAPLAPRPELARVPDATRDVLRRLQRAPGVHLALVSGRAAADARRLVGLDGLWTIGNHGAELVTPDDAVEIHPDVAGHVDAVAAAFDELSRALGAIHGVLVEDKRYSLSIHTRLADRDAVPTVHAAVERAAAAHGLRVMTGKEICELRAPAAVHKGTAVWALAERLGATGRDASVVFAGDDVTDEDAFAVLRERAEHALTVRVSHVDAPSAAEFVVADTEAMRHVLEQLAALRG